MDHYEVKKEIMNAIVALSASKETCDNISNLHRAKCDELGVDTLSEEHELGLTKAFFLLMDITQRDMQKSLDKVRPFVFPERKASDENNLP